MKLCLALIACALFPSMVLASQEYVILIHGLGRTSQSMKWLEWNLSSAGYKVINVSYPSRHGSIVELSNEYLAPVIAAIPQSAHVHFVTHSLGGILVRQYLSNHAVTNLGRVVMLAPPNQGSELSDSFRRCALGRLILGPAGCELGASASDVPHLLGPLNFDAGVIAGDRSLNPLFSFIVPGPSDGKVSVERTKVEGMRDFLILHHSHTWIMWRKDTLFQIRTYLRTGAFAHA